MVVFVMVATDLDDVEGSAERELCQSRAAGIRVGLPGRRAER
jgi:hypothetical protein